MRFLYLATLAALLGPTAHAAPSAEAAPSASTTTAAAPHTEVEGVPFPETALVAGTRLLLNGVGVHRRAFFKTEVVGLYLPQRTTSAEAALHAPGAKRVRVVMLRDAPGSVASRLFVSDVRRWSSDAEFQQLSAEINAVRALYAATSMHAGDEMVVDWVPGQGIVTRLNGRPFGPPLNNELFFQITCLRPGLSADSPSELKAQLLGQTARP